MKIQINHSERPVQLAAEELRTYLGRMGTEAILPPQWTLGVKDLTEFGLEPPQDPKLDDGYWIQVDRRQAVIWGSNGRSVLLGVYRYLTEIGCRFLRPGAEYEIVPEKQEPEAFFARCAHQASLRHRGACIEGATSLENILDFIDWSPKIGFNSFFLQFQYPHQFLQRWYEHVNNPLLAPQKWTMEQSVQAERIINEAMELRGLIQHRVGHGWTGEALGYTATGWEQDAAELPAEKQALLAELGGKRQLYQGIPTNTNLCYSNPEAVELYSDRVVAYARQHPEADYVHLWLADTPNNVCECAECQKKILTDHYIHMLNVIDEKLTREGLETKLVFLLYQELLWAPEMEKLQHPERFVLMFAPISRTFTKSYQQAGELPEVPPYELNHIQMPVSMEENLAFLRAWQEKVSCDSFIYDYHLGKAHYGDPGYMTISRICCEDLKANRSLGMNGFSSCQELRAFFPNALPNYVMGLVSMDTEQAFDEVAADYFSSAYGEKGTEVMAYLQRISALYDMDDFVGHGRIEAEEMQRRLAEVMKLTEAFEPVICRQLDRTLPPVSRRFWKELAYHREYVRALTRAMQRRAAGEDSSEEYRAFARLIREQEPEFEKSLDVYRVLEVTHNYTGLRE